MKGRLGLKGSTVLVGSVLALAGSGAVALTPGALAAPALQKCANKSETIEIQGAPTEAPRKYKITYKAISAGGVSCAAAYKFLALQAKNKTTVAPEKYKCTIGHFKAPAGLVPQVCTKPGAKIEYAFPGG
jgi:hypothetical protein